MSNPKITVAQATYNCVRCLEESIISIVNQTYTNIEYIIIDGGSTDGTLELVKKYKEKISVLVSEPDKGIYDAMNKALNLATGDFIIFLGADDHFLSWRTLEKVAPKLVNMDYVFYGQIFFEGYNLLHKGKFNKFTRARFNYCHQSIFYPRSVYKQYQYDCKYRLYADNEYNFRVSSNYPFKWIGETVAFYASGGESERCNDEEWNKVRDKYILKYCGIIPYLYRKVWLLYKKIK